MNILVVGASKGTGAACVTSALARGHRVTAFARTPEKLDLVHEHLTKVAGSFFDPESIERAVAGQEAVIVTASSSSLSDFKKTPDYFSRGTKCCIDAMKKHGVRRLVILSALGVGESREAMGILLRVLMVDGILKPAYRDHDVQERLTRESGLDWTIARPTRLTNGPARGKYARSERANAKVPSSISRGDVADFMVDACTSRDTIGKVIQLGG
jgi:uncharacterized protein YbjT (DUF2867 family)